MSFDSGSMRAEPAPRKRRVKAAPEPSSDLREIVSSLSVTQVTELAESGMAELADIIAAERAGKGRKTILALVKSDSGKVYPQYDKA